MTMYVPTSQRRCTKFETLYCLAIQIKGIQRLGPVTNSINSVYNHFIAKDGSPIMPSKELKWQLETFPVVEKMIL